MAIPDRPVPRTSARRETTIHIRAPVQTRDLIDRAAAASGKTRTEFMLDSARRQAIDVLLDQRLFVLGEEQHAEFLRVLDAPPPPGPKLRALMKKRPPWEA
jgi:uncharacterized protein (DUF1778 family)